MLPVHGGYVVAVSHGGAESNREIVGAQLNDLELDCVFVEQPTRDGRLQFVFQFCFKAIASIRLSGCQSKQQNEGDPYRLHLKLFINDLNIEPNTIYY